MTQPPSASADGVWRHLRLAPGLAAPDVPMDDGASAALVVQGGRIAWLGPEEALPAAYASLPRHATTRAVPGPRRDRSTATPTWSTAASARMNLLCA